MSQDAVNFKPPMSLLPFFASEKFITLQLGPVGCLARDTKIATENGFIPISEIDQPTRVVSWNAESNQFQLSQATRAFPKGRDYLYRVTTPQGVFDASGNHQLLCADGEYRHVRTLRVGDMLSTYGGSLPQTSSELYQTLSTLDAPHCSQKDVDYLDGYAVLARLYGQPFLLGAVDDRVFAQAPDGARTSTCFDALYDTYLSGGQMALTPSRSRYGLYDARTQTGGFYPQNERRLSAVVGRIFAELYERTSLHSRAAVLSLQKTTGRLKSLLSGLLNRSHTPPSGLSTTDRAIISIERLQTQEAYWDIQVLGTENYVTIDGAVHHNSTKTSAGIMKIAHHAAMMHPCKDGIRRSRAVWVRNTRQMLWDTSIPDFLKWFPDGAAGTLMKTEMKFLLRFNDVECEVLFRGLDDGNDVRRLLSLQASFAIFDEFREINPDVFSTMQGRLGRYPDKMLVPPQPGVHNGGCIKEDGTSNAHVWGMSNPPDSDTYWEQYFSDPPENADCFIQPSGTSDEADWLHFLPDGYYENLMQSNDEDWVDVYVHSKFGKSLAGKPVFRSFDSRYHVAEKGLTPIVSENHPLIIGMDFGLTPACTINQQDARGRFLTLSELTSEGMGILRFCRELLRPHLTNKFPGHPVIIIGDPAGKQRAQTDERSVFDVLKAEGFTIIPAKTNSIQARIASVENLLSGQVDTGARHLIDPSCKKLITALRSGYRYKMKTNGEIEDKPEKNFYSHICFVAGTKIAVPGGSRNIEDLHVGDYVTTPFGMQLVLRAGKSQIANVTEYYLSNGETITATPDHPVYLPERGCFVPIDTIQYTEVLLSIGDKQWDDLEKTLSKSTMALDTIGSLVGTISQTTTNTAGSTCIESYGKTLMARYLKGIQSTIKTAIELITPSKILSLCINPTTRYCTTMSASKEETSTQSRLSNSLERQQKYGTSLKKVGSGTPNTLKKLLRTVQTKLDSALIAGLRLLVQQGPLSAGFAPQLVSQRHAELVASMTSKESALFAEKLSQSISMQKQKPVVRIVGKKALEKPEQVYALTVENERAYFANGVLVHNCDAHQYACLHVDQTFGGAYQLANKRRNITISNMKAWI